MSSRHFETSSVTSEKHEAAKIAARKILAAYPSSEKATRDYIALMVATIETYSLGVIRRVADPQSGIAARVRYLPTQFELVEFCNQIEDMLRKLQQPTAAQRIAATPKEALGPILKTVEQRKAFVKRELGYDPAAGRLEREAWCFKVPPPRVDISDLPDAPVRDWAKAEAEAFAWIEGQRK